VFINGKAKAGDVIAIYSGTVYRAPDMSLMCNFVFTDNQYPFSPLKPFPLSLAFLDLHIYLVTRQDELIIDGNPSGVSQQIYSMNREKANTRIRLLKRDPQWKDLEMWKDNPYAVAQFVNHSSAGRYPVNFCNGRTGANVFCFDYDFPGDMPQSLRCYIPNVGFSDNDSPATSAVPSLLFVALRDLEDEELFLNYKFNTRELSKLPNWYKP
jgi:hypothetical protein